MPRISPSEQIEQELLAINKQNIDQLLRYMRDNGFYTQSCHRHHCYQGGLAEHALQTMRFALRQWEQDKVSGNQDALGTTRDSIVFAALLHDLCDVHGPYHIDDHGRKSAWVIKQLKVDFTQQEFLAIRFHMSLRGKETHFLYQDARRSYLRRLIHRADGKSAARQTGADLEDRQCYPDFVNPDSRGGNPSETAQKVREEAEKKTPNPQRISIDFSLDFISDCSETTEEINPSVLAEIFEEALRTIL